MLLNKCFGFAQKMYTRWRQVAPNQLGVAVAQRAKIWRFGTADIVGELNQTTVLRDGLLDLLTDLLDNVFWQRAQRQARNNR